MDKKVLYEFIDVSLTEQNISNCQKLNFVIKRGEILYLRDINPKQGERLIEAMFGRIRPCTGKVLLCGDPVCDYTEVQKSGLNQLIGTMALDDLSEDSIVRDALLHEVKGQGKTKEEENTLVFSALDKYGIRELLTVRVNTLTPFQKQLVVLARSLVNHPVILVAIEPFKGLNSQETQYMQNIFADLALTGLALVILS